MERTRLRRTKKKGIKETPAREKLIKHVLIFFPHLKSEVKYLTNDFLLAHTHPFRRNTLINLITQEKEYYERTGTFEKEKRN